MKKKDSKNIRTFSTGSRRDINTNKGRWDLMPMLALQDLARHFQVGGIKYKDRNWELGEPLSVYLDSAFRHLAQCTLKIENESHSIAAAWNILCFHQTQKLIKLGKLPAELDDLPKLNIKPEDF